ncbi:8345_t:CDS:2 [Ambispora gerdemannii]|uniref:8345_t:CDS:1 n=1 Tax=Ambispora gerdemannii TaxID=144530 RepID=A0A9N8YPV6_9GLOM|nr:8345_t:CDS:2 [Ambispora gerdemannii]
MGWEIVKILNSIFTSDEVEKASTTTPTPSSTTKSKNLRRLSKIEKLKFNTTSTSNSYTLDQIRDKRVESQNRSNNKDNLNNSVNNDIVKNTGSIKHDTISFYSQGIENNNEEDGIAKLNYLHLPEDVKCILEKLREIQKKAETWHIFDQKVLIVVVEKTTGFCLVNIIFFITHTEFNFDFGIRINVNFNPSTNIIAHEFYK